MQIIYLKLKITNKMNVKNIPLIQKNLNQMLSSTYFFYYFTKSILIFYTTMLKI